MISRQPIDVHVSMYENAPGANQDENHHRLGALVSVLDQCCSDEQVKQMTSRLHDALSKGGVIDFIVSVETCCLWANLSLSSFFRQQSPFGNTMFRAAEAAEDQDIIRAVVDHLPNEIIAIQNQVGDSLLHVASRNGRVESVRAIIHRVKANAKPGILKALRMKNLDGSTALHKSRKDKRHEVIRMLIEEDPEMRYEQNKEAKSLFYLAVERGDVEIMKLLLEREVVADIIQGMSLAHAMVIHRRMDMLSMITEKADFFWLKDAKAHNLLHLAANENYKDAVSFMLDHFPQNGGAGYLPEHIASKMGNIDVQMRLLEACTDPTELLNKKGQNVLHILTRCGCNLIVLFVSRNPRLPKILHRKEEDRNTPLHLAAMHWRAISLIWLVTRNELEVKLVNHDFLAARDAAERRNLSPAVVVLS